MCQNYLRYVSLMKTINCGLATEGAQMNERKGLTFSLSRNENTIWKHLTKDILMISVKNIFKTDISFHVLYKKGTNDFEVLK